MKGYVLFVEGKEPPKKVHRNIGGAYKEMHRLSELFPESEVFLLHVVKRVKAGKSIGSHFPPDTDAGMVDIAQLVTHQALPKKEAANDGNKLRNVGASVGGARHENGKK